MGEAELVRRLKQGDREAFDQLYIRYRDSALRTAIYLSGSRQDGEDIVQDTFIKMYQHIGELKNEDGFKSWFFRILTRTAYRTSRKASMELPDEEVDRKADERAMQTNCSEDMVEKILEAEQAVWIRRKVLEMDEKHRTVLVLYYYNDFTTSEIAGIVGCLEGTVKSRLHTARKKLERSILADEKKERRARNEKAETQCPSFFKGTAHAD